MSNLFGERFGELRVEHNVPRVDIATIFGVSKSTVGFWEREGRMPSFDELHLICYLFSTSLDYLFGISSFPPISFASKDAIEQFVSSIHYKNYHEYDGDYLEYITELLEEVRDYYDDLVVKNDEIIDKLESIGKEEMLNQLYNVQNVARNPINEICDELVNISSAIKEYRNNKERVIAAANEHEKKLRILKETYPTCSVSQYSKPFINRLYSHVMKKKREAEIEE